jgi:hypothetical protein
MPMQYVGGYSDHRAALDCVSNKFGAARRDAGDGRFFNDGTRLH